VKDRIFLGRLSIFLERWDFSNVRWELSIAPMDMVKNDTSARWVRYIGIFFSSKKDMKLAIGDTNPSDTSHFQASNRTICVAKRHDYWAYRTHLNEESWSHSLSQAMFDACKDG
jgi:hypothetical protein